MNIAFSFIFSEPMKEPDPTRETEFYPATVDLGKVVQQGKRTIFRDVFREQGKGGRCQREARKWNPISAPESDEL